MIAGRDVLLISTLHDPRGVFLNAVPQVGSVVLESYRGWVVNVTTTTDRGVKEALRTLALAGVVVTEPDTDKPIVADKIENDHVNLLSNSIGVAEKLGVGKIQYTDGDRIATAAMHYPDDLRRMAQRASELLREGESYINFRRSVEDYFTHHPPLVQTEFECNRIYSEVFGMPLDLGSTGAGMSLGTLREIVQKSPQLEPVSFPEPKWLLIAKEMGVSIKSEETQNVLTFETPDQFPTKEKNSPYEKIQQEYMATYGVASTVSPNEWNLRFNTERQYLTLLRNHLASFGLDGIKREQIVGKIERSLVSAEGRHAAINEALALSPEETHLVVQGRAENVLAQQPSHRERS